MNERFCVHICAFWNIPQVKRLGIVVVGPWVICPLVGKARNLLSPEATYHAAEK